MLVRNFWPTSSAPRTDTRQPCSLDVPLSRLAPLSLLRFFCWGPLSLWRAFPPPPPPELSLSCFLDFLCDDDRAFVGLAPLPVTLFVLDLRRWTPAGLPGLRRLSITIVLSCSLAADIGAPNLLGARQSSRRAALAVAGSGRPPLDRRVARISVGNGCLFFSWRCDRGPFSRTTSPRPRD